MDAATAVMVVARGIIPKSITARRTMEITEKVNDDVCRVKSCGG